MRLPKKVKIAGHTYKVIYPYKFKGKEKGILGQCVYNQSIIRIIDKDRWGCKLSASRSQQILLHEILHAINCHYNNYRLKEEDVERIAEGIYQVLKDNPKLLRSK